MGVSRTTQLHVLQLLNVVVRDGGDNIFHFGHETLKKRWETLNKVSTRFSLQKIKPEYCNYFKKVRDFTPCKFLFSCKNKKES